jgi:hypothetical protein
MFDSDVDGLHSLSNASRSATDKGEAFNDDALQEGGL